MDIRAIDKAESRLRTARTAVSEMESIQEWNSFYDKWYVFLSAFKNVYTVLEQGAKVSPQSRQWFGGKQNERRNDPLLRYLYEARNDDEHGLGSSVELEPETLDVGIFKPGFSEVVTINAPGVSNVTVMGMAPGGTAYRHVGPLGQASISATSRDKKPILARKTDAHPILIPVKDRSLTVFQPPNSHRGVELPNNMPLTVAKLAVSYLEKLVSQAREKHKP